MPSGSAPDRVNSSVWQMPVALISTSTSTGPRALELHRLDLERLAGLEGHGGADIHVCFSLVVPNSVGTRAIAGADAQDRASHGRRFSGS